MMNKAIVSDEEELIYAIDIGTRNVVGLLALRADNDYTVVDWQIEQHRHRAMYDGQIHDIPQVVDIISSITSQLGARNNITLRRVAIAAAGRALKTIKLTVQDKFDESRQIDESLLKALKVAAISQAQQQMDTASEETTDYYCVGFTVISYGVDGVELANPLGHSAQHFTANIIATFLPHSVVNSLYTAVEQAGLQVGYLTLEPIAALAIAVPESYRLLNIALVDIGAGTSDIAITKEGLVYAYGMVNHAGDEISEALVQRYLVDFNTAEQIKIDLAFQDEQRFCDIVGLEHIISTADILQSIEASIDNLAAAISEKIVDVNQRPPSAVFLIGGGCQLPTLASKIAGQLQLDPGRVVIKPATSLNDINYRTAPFEGPEFITPLGIAYLAKDDREGDFLQLTVNGREVKLYNSKQLTVLDALVLLGFNSRSLLPRRGKSLRVTINGQTKRFAGQHGEAASVKVNEQSASLEQLINARDVIEVIFAKDGLDATAQLSDAVDSEKRVYYEGEPMALLPNLRLNGQPANGDEKLKEGDQITYNEIKTIADLAEYRDVDLAFLTVNGAVKASDYQLRADDKIQFVDSKLARSARQDEPHKAADTARSIGVVVNGNPVVIYSNKAQFIFVDIFEVIDFDITKPQGILELKLNGEKAGYSDELQDGDTIELTWRK